MLARAEKSKLGVSDNLMSYFFHRNKTRRTFHSDARVLLQLQPHHRIICLVLPTSGNPVTSTQVREKSSKTIPRARGKTGVMRARPEKIGCSTTPKRSLAEALVSLRTICHF